MLQSVAGAATESDAATSDASPQTSDSCQFAKVLWGNITHTALVTIFQPSRHKTIFRTTIKAEFGGKVIEYYLVRQCSVGRIIPAEHA